MPEERPAQRHMQYRIAIRSVQLNVVDYVAHPDKNSQYHLPADDKLTQPGAEPTYPLL